MVRRAENLDGLPDWKNTSKRAGVAAVVFFVMVVVLLGRPIGSGLVLGMIMFVAYLPLGYATDSAIYRFRRRRRR